MDPPPPIASNCGAFSWRTTHSTAAWDMPELETIDAEDTSPFGPTLTITTTLPLIVGSEFSPAW